MSEAVPAADPPASAPRWGARRIIGVALRVLVLLVLWYVVFFAYQIGLLRGTISLLLVLGAGTTIVIVLYRLLGKRTTLGWLRHPLRPDSRLYLAQFLLRGLVWVLVGYLATIAIPRSLLGDVGSSLVVAIWVSVGVLVAGGLVPSVRIHWLTNAAFAVAALILVVQIVRVNIPAPGAVAISSPLTGEWDVGSGGRSALLSHHYPLPQQRDALDLLIAFPRSATKPLTKLTEFAAYGQEVRSPADGTVVRAEDEFADQEIGTTNAEHPAGNNVVIDLGDGRFVMLAHLQPNSVQVEVGDRVTAGTKLGLVGNSGNTSEPHLHIQIQSGPDLLTADGHPTPGLVTYPITFDDATRTRGGQESQPATDLRTNDVVTFG